ncbi:MAG TPA: flagellar biosynthesis protein FlhB [Planctomycetaceae bacterium]|nr:flagellar biosynthesis protein FlhB [Planctomycetaceae bacterium]
MSTDEFGERTEQPTERRRTQARERGNVARSIDLTAAGLMLGAATVFYLLAVPLCRTLAELTAALLRSAGRQRLDSTDVVQLFRNILQVIAPNLLAVLLTMMATAFIWNVVQVGILIAPEALQPQLGRLNPLNGFRRIFSVTALMRLGVSLAKLAIVVAIAVWSIGSLLPQVTQLIGLQPGATLVFMEGALVKLAFQVSAALVFLALLDFLYQRWRLEQDLKMTKQEIRDEMKEMEGNPLMRQRRREAHRKVAQARELHQVRTADVVITNPTEIAVAIKYDPKKMPAPVVVAKGMGEIAASIRRIAIENRVPIIERKELARALYRTIKVGQAIPVEMYQVFVEIMAYVYKLTGKTPRGLS